MYLSYVQAGHRRVLLLLLHLLGLQDHGLRHLALPSALLLAAAHVALNEKVGEEREEAGDVGEVGRGEAGGKFAVRDGRGSFSVSE